MFLSYGAGSSTRLSYKCAAQAAPAPAAATTTGRTRVSISSRNRSGWRNDAKWLASSISANSLTGASTSSKNARARSAGVMTSWSPWKTKNGSSKRVPSARSSNASSSG